MGRLVVLSGPSCVGKGPLCAALRRLHPELAEPLQPVILYNDRAPRPGEKDGVDYYFSPRQEIEALAGRAGFVVMDVRGDLQALDLGELDRLLKRGDAFFEGNPFVGCRLLELPDRDIMSVFLAPLSRAEVEELLEPERRVDLAKFVTDVMRRKLLRRTARQKGVLSLKDLENIERRASSAYAEMQEAWRFDRVIPNHDGEDSENWEAFYYPVGDARRALKAFAALLSGEDAPGAERWEEDLLP
jgi:guanylate kinase